MNDEDVVTVTIDRVGAEGDGIAAAPDGATLYIPATLPGELVSVRTLRRQGGSRFAACDSILRASEARVAPSCLHFGVCGGCVLQHWREAEYCTWKTGLLEHALRRAGFADPHIEPIQVSPPRSRRRMDLAAQRTPQGVAVGLNRRATASADVRGRATARVAQRGRPADRAGAPQSGAAICDLAECHVLHPALFALVAPLRHLLARLQCFRRDASIIANLLDHGTDLLLRTDSPPDRHDRERLIDFARSHRLLRLAWAPTRGSVEPIVVLQLPVITLSGVPVEPPEGAFLQASCDGEAAIVRAVGAGLPEQLPSRGRVAEFYAGSGSLTFALAQRLRVMAWDGDAAAVAALRQASNRSGLSGRVEVAQRDLARQPVAAKDLAGFAMVVLDPPFAGAAAQVAQIAVARPERVIYVSCNPATLGRDARVLHDAGYQLEAATPIDQFPWSARLESVSVFVRR